MTDTHSLTRKDGHWLGRFQAMGSPCDILMEVDDADTAGRLVDIAAAEARRIERKFSRYRKDSVTHRINGSSGRPVDVDEETAALIDYAAQCYQLSGGRFDITSGVLRRVWRFDGTDRVPSAEAVAKVLPLVGWERVEWSRPAITVPKGMEIDLGGIGKEYAVDRTARLLAREQESSILVNYGGDLYVNRPRRDGSGWFIGVEDPGASQPLADGRASLGRFELRRGGIATSGDSRRYLLANGIRYGHILSPATGWPVENAPRSVTVAAGTCTEAGLLATFAMLYGGDAEPFLDNEKVRYWCVR